MVLYRVLLTVLCFLYAALQVVNPLQTTHTRCRCLNKLAVQYSEGNGFRVMFCSCQPSFSKQRLFSSASLLGSLLAVIVFKYHQDHGTVYFFDLFHFLSKNNLNHYTTSEKQGLILHTVCWKSSVQREFLMYQTVFFLWGCLVCETLRPRVKYCRWIAFTFGTDIHFPGELMV